MTKNIEINSYENRKGTCLSRLQSLSGVRSRGTRLIAQYTLENPEETSYLTITEFAKKIGLSASTISRFCAHLGYDGYRAFQIDLAACLVGGNSSISDYFRPSDDPATIIDRVFEMNRQSLYDTRRLLQDSDVVAVSNLIISAKRLFLLGLGISGDIAHVSAMRFSSLGLSVVPITEPFEAIFALTSITKDDLMIGISHTGMLSLVAKLFEFAKRQGVTTVGITNYADSPLSELCDHLLLTSFRERRVNAAVSSSAIAQMCIIDALYFLVASNRVSVAEELATDIEKLTEELLRIPSRTVKHRDKARSVKPNP